MTTGLILTTAYFSNHFKGDEKKEYKNEEYGFETLIDDEWFIVPIQQGTSQQIHLRKKSSNSMENYCFVVCVNIPVKLKQDEYFDSAVEQMIKIHQLNPTTKIKSLDRKRKKNSQGYEYEEIDYVLYHKDLDQNHRYIVSIFYKDRVGVLINTSNELSRFQEDYAENLVENFKFVQRDISQFKKFHSDSQKFSFEYPKDWKLFETYGSGFHRIEILEGDKPSKGSLIIHHTDSSLDEYGKKCLDSIKGIQKYEMHADIIETEFKQNFHGYHYLEINYQIVSPNSRIKYKDCIFVENSNALIIQTKGSPFQYEEDYLEKIIQEIKFH